MKGHATMKRILFATVAAAALAVNPARAQVATYDAANYVQWIAQAKSMGDSLTTLNNQLQQAQMISAVMRDPVSLMQMAPGLLTGGSQSPLGENMAGVMQMASGAQRLAGTVSNLAGQIQNQNTFYMPRMNGNFINTLMTLRANQTSAVQAQLQTLMGSQAERLSGLRVLQARINMGGDVNTMASLSARMQSEMAVAQGHDQQIASLIGLSQIQQQVEHQQMMQKGALDDEQFLASRTAASRRILDGDPGTPAAMQTIAANGFAPPTFQASAQ